MYIILYNPLSKNKKAKRVTKKIVELFKANKAPFRLKSLLKIKDIEQYIKSRPKDINFLLLGGDGTINTFINQTYSLHLEQKIYLIGVGSGNDFMRTLKQQKPKTQPVMRMKYDRKSRYFINGSGLGMDGMIAHKVNQSKSKSQFNYFYHAIRTFISFKPKYMEAVIDGELHTFKKAYLINVNSGQYIGGGMRLTPNAVLEEDEFEVLIVHRLSKILLLLIFISVYLGFHTKFKRYVFTKKAKHVKATMFSSQIAQCDGETLPGTRTIEVSTTGKKAAFKVFDKNQIQTEKNT